MMGNPFGRIIGNHIHLNDYIHNKLQWETWFKAENQKRKLAQLSSAASATPTGKAFIYAPYTLFM